MFLRIGDQLTHESRVRQLDCSRMEAELRLGVHLDGESLVVTGHEAVDVVMRVDPSWFEGRRFRWVRWAWVVHNLVGHPLLQVLAWAGHTKLGLRVHADPGAQAQGCSCAPGSA